MPEEKADLLHAIYDRIVVAGPSIRSLRLTAAAYAHGMAFALPEKVVWRAPKRCWARANSPPHAHRGSR